jgi:hypothetical protein
MDTETKVGRTLDLLCQKINLVLGVMPKADAVDGLTEQVKELRPELADASAELAKAWKVLRPKLEDCTPEKLATVFKITIVTTDDVEMATLEPLDKGCKATSAFVGMLDDPLVDLAVLAKACRDGNIL